MEIFLMQRGHPLWEKTIEFAEHCSWKAGSALARMMRENRFLDWERVAVAAEDGRLAGYCTFARKDELPEEAGYSPFIGFVFVDEAFRGRRLSEKMIDCVCRYASGIGCRTVYLMSGEQGLYEKYGFTKIGDFDTVYGTRDQLFARDLTEERHEQGMGR